MATRIYGIKKSSAYGKRQQSIVNRMKATKNRRKAISAAN
jgi:hypothetical protein